MTRYTDLSISIRAAWNRQHMLNGARHVKNVPAWVCHVSRNEGYDTVLDERELSLDQVEQVADLIDSFHLGQGKAVRAAVGMAHNDMREGLERQLDAAEKAAARIPELRKALGIE